MSIKMVSEREAWAMCWFFLGLGLVIGGVVGWNLGFLEGQGAAIVALVGDAP